MKKCGRSDNTNMKLPDHFCHLPFTYIYPEHNGSWKPCCKSDVYPEKKIPFEEWWYDDADLNELRDALLNEEPTPVLEKYCYPCRVPESKGITSHRQNTLKHFPKDMLDKIVSSYLKTGAIVESDRIYTVKVRGFGNTCNLKCYMCFPGNSTQRVNELLKMPEENSDIFFTDKRGYWHLEQIKQGRKDVSLEVEQIYGTIDAVADYIGIITFSGGEPLLIEEYYNLMDKLIESGHAKYITIVLNTNLTVLGLKDKDIRDYFKEFKHIAINASIDDIFDRDDWIRYPSKFEEVVKNYYELKKCKNVLISVNVTWSILNIANAENILNYFQENDIDFNNNLNFVNSPVVLHPKNYPFKDELIDKYSKSSNKSIRELAQMLTLDFNQEEFDQAISYIKTLDTVRSIKSYDIFTELGEFLT